MKTRTRGVAALACWLVSIAMVGNAYAQDAAATASYVEPDSVRIGESFTIGFTVTRSLPGDVQFPALIELPDALEQRGAVQIRTDSDGLEWRADYPVVAWRPDTLRIAPHPVVVGGSQSPPLAIDVPVIVVRSILPSDSAELALRDPKPFLRVRSFPWWIIALLVLAAGLFWWFRRDRAEAPTPVVPLGPGGRALQDFDALRQAWLAGGLPGDRFYDDYEATLRRYARDTRGWSPAKGLRALGERDEPLLVALGRSLKARFARVWGATDGPISDLDAGAAFVRSEMPPEPSHDE